MGMNKEKKPKKTDIKKNKGGIAYVYNMDDAGCYNSLIWGNAVGLVA
jgi:hypothetical protein